MDIKDLRHFIQESLTVEIETSRLSPNYLTIKLKWDGITFSESTERIRIEDTYE